MGSSVILLPHEKPPTEDTRREEPSEHRRMRVIEDVGYCQWRQPEKAVQRRLGEGEGSEEGEVLLSLTLPPSHEDEGTRTQPTPNAIPCPHEPTVPNLWRLD